MQALSILSRYMLRLVLLAGFAAAPMLPASAVPISYQFAGSASGTLGGIAFANAAFTLAGSGDTGDLIEIDVGILLAPLAGLQIELAGLGGAAAVNQVYFYVNQGLPGAGFIDAIDGDVAGGMSAALAFYNGAAALAPVALESAFFAPFETTGGILLIESAAPLVFSAELDGEVPVPEPGALALLALGLLLLARRKRR